MVANTPSDLRAVIGQKQPQTQSPSLTAEPDLFDKRSRVSYQSAGKLQEKTPQGIQIQPFKAKLHPHMACKNAKAHRRLAAGQSDGADHSPATKVMN